MMMAAFTALNGEAAKAAGGTRVDRTDSGGRPGSPEGIDGQEAEFRRAAGEESPIKREASNRCDADREGRSASFSWAGWPESHKQTRSASRSSPSPDSRREGSFVAPKSTRSPYASPPQELRSYSKSTSHDRWGSLQEHSPDYEQASRTDTPPDDVAPRRGSEQADTGSGNASPDDDDDDGSGVFGSQYEHGLAQVAKKRKRNFSNRTKTGCLTCRKRKKKCDEHKPQCNNCTRGGFPCAGYPPQRGTWIRPEAKPVQVTIESKDPNYVPPGAYATPQQAAYAKPPPPQKRDAVAYNRGQPQLRITPPSTQGQPVRGDDDRRSMPTLASSMANSEPKLSAISAYSNLSNPYITPVSAGTPMTPFADRTPPDYDRHERRMPPLQDLTRGDAAARSMPPPPPPQSHTTLLSLSQLRTHSPPGSQQSLAPSPSLTPGQLTLAHPDYAHAPAKKPPRVEKDEMLKGHPFFPLDATLVRERERCVDACWRFNNSASPSLGVSPDERIRLFHSILVPPASSASSPARTGIVGDNVTVEAPFHCDYGYNLRIGSHSWLMRNCYVSDVGEVRIGNNVVISPNVCIYTSICDPDPRRRKGARCWQSGRAIVIEDDVVIGPNVVIMPGVRIGRESSVEAGTVVSEDVEARSMASNGRTQRTQRIELL